MNEHFHSDILRNDLIKMQENSKLNAEFFFAVGTGSTAKSNVCLEHFRMNNFSKWVTIYPTTPGSGQIVLSTQSFNNSGILRV